MTISDNSSVASLVHMSYLQRVQRVLAVILVTTPWFWPILFGPLPSMLPDLVAWACGATMLGLFPLIRNQLVWIIPRGLVFVAVGSSLLAFIQYFDYDEFFGLWIATTRPGHATANVHQTNMLATLLVSGLWGLWFLVKSRQLTIAFATVFGALVVGAIAATASRTGMIQLLFFCLLVIYCSPSQRKAHTLFALALGIFYVAIAQLLPWFLEVFRGIAIDRSLLGRFSGDVGCASRRVVWSNVLHLISLKPWFGWGAGELMYAQYITAFDGVRYCEKMSNAHNIFLHLAVTKGIPFAIIVFGLSIFVFFKIKPWREKLLVMNFGWGVLLAIAIHSMLEYPVWFGVYQMLVLQVVVLMLIVKGAQSFKHQPDGLLKAKVKPWIFSSVGLLFVLSLVFWDYLKVSQLYLPYEWRLAYYKEDTLNRTRDTVLFKSHVLIAQVVTTPATPENADRLLAAALESLRTAPDPRIIKQVIAAAAMAGRQDLVSLHTARFEAAWPKDYAEWLASQQKLGAS